MQLNSITNIVIFSVFIIVLIAFSLSPAIWIGTKCQSKYNLTPTETQQCVAFFTLFITVLFASFLYF